MPKPPKLQHGLVLNYDFLFRDRYERGIKDAPYPHPCVVFHIGRGGEGKTQVYVAPISHSPPAQGVAAVEIPERDAQRLGLDARRQWLKTHELNRFEWPSGDLVPIKSGPKRGAYAYGLISRGVFEKARKQILQHGREQRASALDRSFDPRAEMEKIRRERERAAGQTVRGGDTRRPADTENEG